MNLSLRSFDVTESADSERKRSKKQLDYGLITNDLSDLLIERLICLSNCLSVSQFFLSDNIPHLDGHFDCPHQWTNSER